MEKILIWVFKFISVVAMVPMYGGLKPFYDTCRGLGDIQVSAEGVQDQVSRLFIWHNVFWKKILMKCLNIWHFPFSSIG